MAHDSNRIVAVLEHGVLNCVYVFNLRSSKGCIIPALISYTHFIPLFSQYAQNLTRQRAFRDIFCGHAPSPKFDCYHPRPDPDCAILGAFQDIKLYNMAWLSQNGIFF